MYPPGIHDIHLLKIIITFTANKVSYALSQLLDLQRIIPTSIKETATF